MGLLDKLFSKPRPAEEAPGAPLPLEPDFVPENDLERLLLDVVEGRSDLAPFVQALADAEVFVLFDGESGPFGPVRPLVMPTSQGGHGLCVFTSAGRAEPAERLMPEFTGRFVSFREVLQAAPSGVGLILNPGWRASLENSPEGLEAMRRELG
jgi:hypothetical protein